MEEEKEINKKKKKARKKKISPGQEKPIAAPIDGGLSGLGQALDQVPNKHFISPASDDSAPVSLLASSCTEFPDVISEHQKVLVEFNESIAKDVDVDASSQSAQKNEDPPVLDANPILQNDIAVLDLKESFDETKTRTEHSVTLPKEVVAYPDTNPSHGSNALSDFKESEDGIQTTPHSSTLSKDNGANLSQIEIPSSAVENECSNASLQVAMQETQGSHPNSGTSILTAVKLIENANVQFSTDLFGNSDINHLKLYLEREMKTSQLHRLQISTLEELIAMRDADEARTTTQIKRLRAENAHLEKQVLGLKDMVRSLMQDRSQLLERMVAIQSGKLLSDELEASINASPIDDQHIDGSEFDVTKEGLVINMTNGSVAENTISGPSIEDTVVATTVDRLVPESVELISQKQFDMFGDGQRKISPVEQQSTGIPATVKAEDEVAVAIQLEAFSISSDKNTVSSQVGSITSVSGSKNEMERDDSLTEIKDIIENEENIDTVKESHVLTSSELHRKLSSSDKHQYTDISKEVHFSDAPLIGAPFRLMSFMARYVSGADLATKTANGNKYR